MDDTTLLLKLDLQFFAKDGPGGEKTEPATSKSLMIYEKKVRLPRVRKLLRQFH